jgi:hypothetical protein
MADQVVNAVLYEGYILYPYRATSTKNRQRFTFGRIYPQPFSEAQGGSEPYTMQTQCLVQAASSRAGSRAGSGDAPAIKIKARFLHPVERQVGQLPEPLPAWDGEGEPAFQPVPELRVGQRIYQTWHEVVERDVDVGPLQLERLRDAPQEIPFSFPAMRQWEPVEDEQGRMVGVVVRRQEALRGRMVVAAEAVEPGLYRITAQVFNLTPLEAPFGGSEDEAVLMQTFVSAHVLLAVEGGAFVSLMDPPPALAQAAAGCENQGVWPILIGDEEKGERHTILASPIILYDYPEIAPESPGNLFDSTEIDEILTLRIMTLTDEEKLEMSQVDERARQILQRTESMTNDHLMGMHGVLREIRPVDGGET